MCSTERVWNVEKKRQCDDAHRIQQVLWLTGVDDDDTIWRRMGRHATANKQFSGKMQDFWTTFNTHKHMANNGLLVINQNPVNIKGLLTGLSWTSLFWDQHIMPIESTIHNYMLGQLIHALQWTHLRSLQSQNTAWKVCRMGWWAKNAFICVNDFNEEVNEHKMHSSVWMTLMRRLMSIKCIHLCKWPWWD